MTAFLFNLIEGGQTLAVVGLERSVVREAESILGLFRVARCCYLRTRREKDGALWFLGGGLFWVAAIKAFLNSSTAGTSCEWRASWATCTAMRVGCRAGC